MPGIVNYRIIPHSNINDLCKSMIFMSDFGFLATRYHQERHQMIFLKIEHRGNLYAKIIQRPRG